MEFDIKKVYTSVNADELEVGDKVYVADSLEKLKQRVERNDTTDFFGFLELVYGEGKTFRFKSGGNDHALAYLVEKAEEKKWRPFKDLGELITAWQKKTGVTARANTMPLIWIASKNNNGVRLIAGFKGQFILFEDYEASYEDLFEYYTFLDGTPCGVKE